MQSKIMEKLGRVPQIIQNGMLRNNLARVKSGDGMAIEVFRSLLNTRKCLV